MTFPQPPGHQESMARGSFAARLRWLLKDLAPVSIQLAPTNKVTFSQRTYLKCVACCTLRMGCISASRTRTAISEPENLFTLFSLLLQKKKNSIPLCLLGECVDLLNVEVVWRASEIQRDHL